jgi:hypothetical protein
MARARFSITFKAKPGVMKDAEDYVEVFTDQKDAIAAELAGLKSTIKSDSYFRFSSAGIDIQKDKNDTVVLFDIKPELHKKLSIYQAAMMRVKGILQQARERMEAVNADK